MAGENEILSTAVELARPLAAKSNHTRGQVKETLYATALASLRTTTAT